MPYGDKKSYSFFKMKYSNSAFPFKSPMKEGTKEQKLAAVKGYKEHGHKKGYQAYLDKVMGGKTKVDGMTTVTTKKK